MRSVAMLFVKDFTKDLHEFLMNLDHRPFLFLGYEKKVTRGEPNLSYQWGPNKICDECGLTSYFKLFEKAWGVSQSLIYIVTCSL